MKFGLNMLAAAAIAALSTFGSPGAQAAQSELQRGSDASVVGSASVVGGSILLLAGAGYLVVKSVETVADGVVVVLKGASQAGEVSIKLSGKALHGVSMAVGGTVQVVAIASGTVLVVSGEVLAFLPNELGKALLHHAPVSARSST